MPIQPPVFQVSDLLTEMRQLLERSYAEVWIEGELSSLSAPASGHLYFSLKDEQAQLRCAMFRNRAQLSRYRPKVGDLVRVRAKISVYTARGDLQCIVQHIEEAGEGVLQRRFEELQAELRQAGLFDEQHKLAIPGFARCIGLITSPSGAAVRDILTTLQRRAPSIPVIIYPAVVQGESAPASLIQAISDAVQHARCDVLILSRGGGSMEDLWCFNDAQLAKTIFSCPIPIVSGVGHEVDVTIADLVADRRAPTPTAAAELLSPDRAQLENSLSSMAFRLPRSFQRNMQRLAQTVDLCFSRLQHPRDQLRRHTEQLRQQSHRLHRATQHKLISVGQRAAQQRRQLATLNPQQLVSAKRAASVTLRQRLITANKHFLRDRQLKFSALTEGLQLVSPLATLGRGFAVARDKNGNIIRDAATTERDDLISVDLHRGELKCKVLEAKS